MQVRDRARGVGAHPLAQREQRERSDLGQARLGVALGLGVAALLGGTVRALLFEVEPIDPAAYGLVAAVVFVIAAVSAAVPAWRASRTDPLASLRAEP
jgi:ABC-type antimicrobial peptide transport system permease subunit